MKMDESVCLFVFNLVHKASVIVASRGNNMEQLLPCQEVELDGAWRPIFHVYMLRWSVL